MDCSPSPAGAWGSSMNLGMYNHACHETMPTMVPPCHSSTKLCQICNNHAIRAYSTLNVRIDTFARTWRSSMVHAKVFRRSTLLTEPRRQRLQSQFITSVPQPKHASECSHWRQSPNGREGEVSQRPWQPQPFAVVVHHTSMPRPRHPTECLG